MTDSILLIVNGQYGQYIPQIAAEILTEWGIDSQDLETLSAGPESPYYWETWERVLNNASKTDSNGRAWTLHQDCDLWAYCDELMTDDEYLNLFGEDRHDG